MNARRYILTDERYPIAVGEYVGGVSSKTIATKYGWEYSSFRRTMSEQGESARRKQARAGNALPDAPAETPAREPIPNIVIFPHVIKAYPLPEPDPEPELGDDWDEWKDKLLRLKRKKPFVWMLRLSDEHIGDADPRALAMNVEIARIVQPDILVHLGDTFDFDNFSSFPKARGRVTLDMIENAKPRYRQYQGALHEAAPDAISVLGSGNHNFRASRKADENPSFGDTLERAYADMVRDNGRVLWLRWKEELIIGNLHSEHGTYVGDNAHKKLLEKRIRFAMSAEQGHTHSVAMTAAVTYPPNAGHRVIVFGVMAGYGGNIPPLYEIPRTDKSQYVHSCVLWGINLDGYDVHPSVIVYHERGNGELVACVNQREIVITAEQAKGA
jgi:hypothetical protein